MGLIALTQSEQWLVSWGGAPVLPIDIHTAIVQATLRPAIQIAVILFLYNHE